MKIISIDQIKKLRQKTSAPIMECKKALAEAKGDQKKAEALLRRWGVLKGEKKAGREATQGMIACYIHFSGRIGSLVEIGCETDFVAKTKELNFLAKELAMQIASMNPKSVDSLLKQEYIRDSKMTVGELVKSMAGKVGENIKVKRFTRYEVGR